MCDVMNQCVDALSMISPPPLLSVSRDCNLADEVFIKLMEILDIDMKIVLVVVVYS